VDVVKGLWDGWEEGALVLDKAAGRYFDEAKMHVLDHRGRFFKVRGPLNVARMPQGHPVIVQAGASEQGRELGAATADVIYAISSSVDAARTYYADVKGRMAKYGREPDDLKILPALCPVVGRTRGEAQAKYDELQALIDPLAGLGALYSTFGDLSGYPLDGPLPDGALGSQELRSVSALLVERLKREKPTIRELYLRAGLTGSARIGTPNDIADAMQEWFEAEACDGFNITPATLPAGGEDFVEMVVPELQRRGLFRTEYEGKTLRENLGLRPVTSRYSRDRRAAE
jgi:FMN-dependent oxidoreductase (nitrilotriacetate monooxygenase family)